MTAVRSSPPKTSPLAKLERWLSEPIRGLQALKFVLLVLLVDMTYNLVAAIVLINVIGVKLPPSGNADLLDGSHSWLYIMALFLAAVLLEESVFRLLPLGVARLLRASLPVMLMVAVLASAVFGYLHGGFANVLLQGMGGLLYSITYLKLGGWKGRAWQGWLCTMLIHFLFDALLCSAVLLRP